MRVLFLFYEYLFKNKYFLSIDSFRLATAFRFAANKADSKSAALRSASERFSEEYAANAQGSPWLTSTSIDIKLLYFHFAIPISFL